MQLHFRVGATFLAFALPLATLAWYGWSVTSIHRAALPTQDVDALAKQELQATAWPLRLKIVEVHMGGDGSCGQSELADALEAGLERESGQQVGREAVAGRPDPLAAVQAREAAASMRDMGEYEFSVYVLPDDGAHLPTSATIGDGLHAWLRASCSASPGDRRALADRVARAMRAAILSPTPPTAFQSAKLSRKYRLCFHLLDASPAQRLVTWDFARDVLPLLQPMLNRVAQLADVVVESQVVRFANLTHVLHNSTAGGVAATQRELQAFLSSNDWQPAPVLLEEGEHPLHFAVFVPERPVRILPDRAARTDGDATEFSIDRWGAVMIARPVPPPQLERAAAPEGPPPSVPLPTDKAQAIARFVVRQLRQLLGMTAGIGCAVRAQAPAGGATGTPDAQEAAAACGLWHEGVPAQGVAVWELHAASRTWAAQHFSDAARALSSLQHLVQHTPLMPVPDRVRDAVRSAVKQLRASLEAQRRHRLAEAAQHARGAAALAHAAYFDADLLPHLYFPLEHLLAVYAPLLAPVLLPVVGVMVQEARRLWGRWHAARKAKVE